LRDKSVVSANDEASLYEARATRRSLKVRRAGPTRRTGGSGGLAVARNGALHVAALVRVVAFG
jgi:hypothetical protein